MEHALFTAHVYSKFLGIVNYVEILCFVFSK